LCHQEVEKKPGREFVFEDVCFLCDEPKEERVPLPEPPPPPKKKKGKKKKDSKEEELPPQPPPVPMMHPVLHCSVCPRAYHPACLEEYCEAVGQPLPPEAEAALGTTPEEGKHVSFFICPQHRCMGCSRNTASAGGLLFRCAEVSE